jgi:hypothetical protein
MSIKELLAMFELQAEFGGHMRAIFSETDVPSTAKHVTRSVRASEVVG